MAEILTYQQRQAVENSGGNLLVSAAAGSGKTKVLVDRLLRHILDKKNPANIDDFLIITYTKAAASELRAKIASKLTERIAEDPQNRHLQQQMQRLYLAKISTVHGFCSDILREYAYRLDLSPDFRVADESECAQLQLRALEDVLNCAYETVDLHDNFRTFIDTQGLGRDDRQIPQIILKVYQSAQCHLDPESWLQWCIHSRDMLEKSDVAMTPWGAYLLTDLKDYLAMQIETLERCVALASMTAEMEKPAALLQETVCQLKELYACESWDAVVEYGQIDYGRLVFSKKCPDTELVEQIKAIRNSCKSGLEKRLRYFGEKSDVILQDLAQCAVAASGLIDLVRAFSKRYDALKLSRGALDFSDLEHRTLDLLIGRKRDTVTSVATEIGNRFQEIMVDEYQDSNEIQDIIFRALTHRRNNCFMVGDVKQSIYQFRLADPGIFLEKYNTYAPVENAGTGEGRRVLLSCNFRSSGGVISGVNDVFVHCMSPQVGGLEYGEDEMLREGIPHISLPEPEVSLFTVDVETDTYAEEASFVAGQIAQLLDGSHYVRESDTLRPVQPEDIAILLRSPGSVGGEFQMALQSRGIRCVTGDSADLFSTKEIDTLISILKVLYNPLQDIPLAAALTSPVFCFTAEDLSLLRSTDHHSSLYRLLQNSNTPKVVAFLRILDHLRQKSRLLSVTELIAEVFLVTEMLSIYSAMPAGEEKMENLQLFYLMASDYETSGQKDLGRFLDFLVAAQERGFGKNSSQQETGAITLMSIHKSKGLEFPIVFLSGLSRSFNQESVRQQVLCDKEFGLGLNCVDMAQRIRYPSIAKWAISRKMLQQSISEEIRVLYVAMTRAKDRLIMTYASKYLQSDLADISTRLKLTNRILMSAEVDCPGAWVLQTAMSRSEAGQLFALGGNSGCASVTEQPWLIQIVSKPIDNPEVADTYQCSEEISVETQNLLHQSIDYSYPYLNATQIPSKLTATQLKGRKKDEEISQGTKQQPALLTKKNEHRSTGKRGKEYGNAIHSVLQYIRYSECSTQNGIYNEVRRLVEEQLISPEQGQMVDCEKILRFFYSKLGSKLCTSDNVLREFKFSILDEADRYYPDAAGEKILLQGVVDCAIVESDCIYVIDFKTDYVTEDTLLSVSEKYRSQVSAYVRALERIYQKPVSTAALYFFELDRFVLI
ncbi:MAG: helicase-exonuclease AddAB subunit AddA [Oscillospiraceae bacterium]|nr:helicase-exonuclease AddAB subunit AddA [Oscillospiraceae bacterium]